MEQKPLGAGDEERVLIRFLERTKEGEYAVIEESSLPYSRIIAETEAIESISIDEEFYYSIS